jgi:uncharacterized protein with HEPN domain
MTTKHTDRVPEYLQHILDAIQRATQYVAGMDLTRFEQDSRTQDAVVRTVQIIGEAANKVRRTDPEFAAPVGFDVRDAESRCTRLFRDRP